MLRKSKIANSEKKNKYNTEEKDPRQKKIRQNKNSNILSWQWIVEKYKYNKKDFITITVIILIVLSLTLLSFYSEDSASSIYQFTVKNIYGNEVDLSIYRGQVLVIVNVASLCTYTDNNYEVLSYINSLKIKGKPIKILAFPCNQFDNQEPGNAVDILKFAQEKKAPFDFFEKVEVKGANAHPLFKYLSANYGPIEWNFYKFIIDDEGMPVKRYTSEADFYKMSSGLQRMFDIDDE